MRKALLVTLLLVFVAGWVGCGDSTHPVVPTSQLAFIRSASIGTLTAARHQSREMRSLGTLPSRKAHVGVGLQPYANGIANGTDSIVLMKNDGTGATVAANQGGTFYSVQLSTDGKKGVVAAEDENGNLQIFIADVTNLQNANPVQLTTDATDHYSPQLSPNNKTVVFVKYDSTAGTDRAYTVPAAGGTQSAINTPDTVDVWTPSFTPDGTKIVFEEDNLDTINIMNVDGTGMKTLTNAGGTAYFDQYPSVSPDGTKLVFSRYGKATHTTEDVYIANIDGSNLKQLTNSGTAAEAWDPMFVNNKIVFVYYNSANGDNDIYSMNIDGSGAKDISSNTQDEYFQY